MSSKEFEPNIVAFCCNWCSYAGADLAGVSRMQYPPNARIIRVMCSGRVEPYFILRALELGADGILIAGCHIGDCHYISGNVEAEKRMESVKELLDRLGIGKDRMRLEWISASEGQKFAATMKEFTEQIRKLGPNPMPKAPKATKDPITLKQRIDALIEDTGAFDCVECGKCTTVCPVAKYNTEFAPRTIVLKATEGQMQTLSTDKDIWTCVTCEQCNSMCPYKVDYSGFIRGLRTEASSLDNVPVCSQGGLMQGVMRVMAHGDFKQNRLGWVTDDIKIAEKGDVFFFTGCAVYFDSIFKDRELDLSGIPQAAVKIMNKGGIIPVVSNDEVCCGHDLNWTGDEAAMQKLMKKNLEVIKASGAKKVVFSCPECLRTFDLDYQELMGDADFEMVHISQLIDDLIKEGKLKLKKNAQKLTFQDSCRLGRHMDIYDQPRNALKASEGTEIVEMENTRDKALCCGVSAWATCDETSRRLQVERLKEAKKTGAECLVTGCYKCLIHLKCAQENKTLVPKEQIDIKIKDLTVAIADSLE
ncbi:MAG: hydrogenase iron-sulfur subunit [Thermoplasmata archaeon]|nr:hydrogenase iron-sulfur subunit [Thermoplasmata archaeon]TFG69057.1 MAG: hydrogenase iron-sulfur subunit [Methanomassiliicoccus sp.]